MKTTRYRSVAVLLCAAALVSCDYEKNAVQDIVGSPAGSAVRFFNFGIGAPNVNFYADDTKLTAVNVTSCTTLPPNVPSEACMTAGSESVNGVGFGNVGSGGLYSTIEPGQHTLTGRISATTDKGLAISTVAANLELGKRYSVYQSGIYNTTTKTVDAFIVEDPVVPEIEWFAANVRFVNAIFNANPMTLYVRNQVTNEEFTIGGATAYKGAGGFVEVPSGVYTLITRYDGSPTDVMTRPDVSLSFAQVYSITARGDITVAPTAACAAANRTCLDWTVHR